MRALLLPLLMYFVTGLVNGREAEPWEFGQQSHQLLRALGSDNVPLAQLRGSEHFVSDAAPEPQRDEEQEPGPSGSTPHRKHSPPAPERPLALLGDEGAHLHRADQLDVQHKAQLIWRSGHPSRGPPQS